KVIKGDGGTVVAGEVIATIDTDAKAAAAAPAPAPAGVKPEPRPVPATPATPAKEAREDARLMPAARKLVEEQGIDPARLTGTGRDGRITKADVLGAAEKTVVPAQAGTQAAPATAKPTLPPAPAPVNVERILGNRPEQRVPMSRLRARIAERLVQSQSTAAILTTFNEVNMQPVMELRKKHQE